MVWDENSINQSINQSITLSYSTLLYYVQHYYQFTHLLSHSHVVVIIVATNHQMTVVCIGGSSDNTELFAAFPPGVSKCIITTTIIINDGPCSYVASKYVVSLTDRLIVLTRLPFIKMSLFFQMTPTEASAAATSLSDNLSKNKSSLFYMISS